MQVVIFLTGRRVATFADKIMRKFGVVRKYLVPSPTSVKVEGFDVDEF